MTALLLLGALLAGPQGDPQGQSLPVFHAEAYVVTTFVVFGKKHGPVSTGLTSANFQATVNKKPVPLDVSEDPRQPGAYVLSINPPRELRDGKSHRIDIKVRNWDRADGKWRDLPLNWTAVFAKPSAGLSPPRF